MARRQGKAVGGACIPVLVIALALGCGPIPAGQLSGTLVEAPDSWTTFLEGDGVICEVESRPDDPHSIQLYCFVHDGALYTQSHRWAMAAWWPVKSWAQIWIEYPDVRVRIGDSLFERRAVHVDGDPEREAVISSIGYDPVPDGIALFRFDPRD